MMKSSSLCKVILGLTFAVLVFLPFGCKTSQPGETGAEVNRRHDRVARIDGELMRSDLDKFLMIDKPSKLTDKRIP